MRACFYGALLVSSVVLSGCATSRGAGEATSVSKTVRRVVAVDVVNSSGYTADVYVAGRLASTLLPNASAIIPLQPTQQTPRVYGVASPLGDASWDSRRRPPAVRLSVRPIYERVPVNPS